MCLCVMGLYRGSLLASREGRRKNCLLLLSSVSILDKTPRGEIDITCPLHIYEQRPHLGSTVWRGWRGRAGGRATAPRRRSPGPRAAPPGSRLTQRGTLYM